MVDARAVVRPCIREPKPSHRAAFTLTIACSTAGPHGCKSAKAIYGHTGQGYIATAISICLAPPCAQPAAGSPWRRCTPAVWPGCGLGSTGTGCTAGCCATAPAAAPWTAASRPGRRVGWRGVEQVCGQWGELTPASTAVPPKEQPSHPHSPSSLTLPRTLMYGWGNLIPGLTLTRILLLKK